MCRKLAAWICFDIEAAIILSLIDGSIRMGKLQIELVLCVARNRNLLDDLWRQSPNLMDKKLHHNLDNLLY